MAKITVIQRKVNKGTEQPVYVRFNADKDWFISTGKIVAPTHFKNGKVVNCTLAPEANDAVQLIVSRLEKAVRDLTSAKQEVTVESVKQRYNTQPSVAKKIENLFADWTEEGKDKLEVLTHELKELQHKVLLKEAEIVEVQKQIGIYKPTDFAQLITNMIKLRTKSKEAAKSIVIKRNRKDKSTKLSASTIAAYTTLLDNIVAWNTKLKRVLHITEINKQTVEDFVEYLIEQKYYNNSIVLLIQKFNSTMAYYKESYNLSDNYKAYTFDYPLKEENVLHLKTVELKAFRNLKYVPKNSAAASKYEKVKDMCLLMSETGLRLRDAELTKGDISDGYIIKRQSKTSGRVQIRYTSRIQHILEKYNFELKAGNTGYFNTAFRKMLSMCTNVPSLFEDVTIVNYSGHNRIEDTKPKWEHMTAHDLRRTMINQCLLRGMRYDKITKMTGHQDFLSFQGYIDRDTTMEEMDDVFSYLDAEATE